MAQKLSKNLSFTLSPNSSDQYGEKGADTPFRIPQIANYFIGVDCLNKNASTAAWLSGRKFSMPS